MLSPASRPFLPARRRSAAVLVLLGAGVVTLSGCSKSEANAPAAQMPPPEVSRLAVAPRDVELPIEYVAQVAGSRQVEVRARVEGTLLQRTYVEGRPVQAGDTLFVIDPAPFQAALEQARGNLAEQQARLAQAERDLKRVLALVADKALSQRDRDAAIAERDKAQAAVRAAQAAVREAEINLGYTKVTAPIAGITSKEVRSEGSLVRPGEDSGLLTTISQLDPAYVNFSYADNELLALRRAVAEGKVSMPEGQGLEVELRLADGSLYPHPGRVNFTDSVIDTGTGSVRARAEFPNPDAALLPGQFVRVRVKGVVRRNVVLVPQRAVMQAPNGKFVYLVGAENKVEMRPIETGAAIGKEWLVERGLGGGEQVVLDNLLKLRPGMPVRIIEPAAPALSAAAGQTAQR